MSPEFQTSRLFRERLIPQGASLVGYAALVHALHVDVLLRSVACVSSASVREGRRMADGLILFDRRYRPADDVGGHLFFALRHEDPDLRALKRIFDALLDDAVAGLVRDPHRRLGPQDLVPVRVADRTPPRPAGCGCRELRRCPGSGHMPRRLGGELAAAPGARQPARHPELLPRDPAHPDP